MSPLRVGVVGGTGFLGGEVVRLLAAHPLAELRAVAGEASAGRLLAEVRPSLRGAGSIEVERFQPDKLADSCDLVFLALPHGCSAEAAAALLDRGLPVIDLGSDFRLRSPEDYARFYGRPAGRPELLDEAHYSLPELTGPIPPGTQLVANPGCFATALALATAPLVPHLAAGARLQAFGVTGSSGSGIGPSAGVHHSLRSSSFTAYKSLRHQHLGEVQQILGQFGPVPPIDFVPHSAPITRGIHITILVRKQDLDGSPLDLFHDRYAACPLVGAVGGEIPLGAVIGSAQSLLGVVGGEDVWVIFSALDNLLKGGSGQAIQNMNLLQGWDETAGLPMLGSWP